MNPVFAISEQLTLMPVIHGSGDYALEVRRLLLSERFESLAVPLPESFREGVLSAVRQLPAVSAVVQVPAEGGRFAGTSNSNQDHQNDDQAPDHDEDVDNLPQASYVPIDPCQPVIAALRVAIEERMSIEFIDLEVEHFLPVTDRLPDAYALKQVPLDQFCAAMLTGVRPPRTHQTQERIEWMGGQLAKLAQRPRRTLALCSILDWPWLRQAAVQPPEALPEPSEVTIPEVYPVSERTLVFLLGELPFITRLFEQARRTLDSDENLSIDGIKALWLAARDHYKQEHGARARRITPKLSQLALQYVRNLTLMEHRFTPSLYTLVVAAQQTAGDQFAIAIAETAKAYGLQTETEAHCLDLGVDQARLPHWPADEQAGGSRRWDEADGPILVGMASRLPGPPVTWKTLSLSPKPLRADQLRWERRWNPYRQCSWPPEDVAIEKFRTHVKDVALNLLGNDLARTEKFSTSLKDGLDLRETLRNWHTGELHVKVLPPSRGSLDCIVMLFDSPADPRDYPMRVTWHAEHQDESSLAFFATDAGANMVGPGIAQATYGGALFLFPPRPLEDIWTDRRFDAATTLEERLLMAGCYYSREKHVVVLSAAPPGAGWRKLAAQLKRKLIHVPLGRFSQDTLAQLQVFHILNGTDVRSYAAHFIRKL